MLLSSYCYNVLTMITWLSTEMSKGNLLGLSTKQEFAFAQCVVLLLLPYCFAA